MASPKSTSSPSSETPTDFLSGKSLLTPAAAGALIMLATNMFRAQFELPGRWVALVLSMMFAGTIFLKQYRYGFSARMIYFLLNTVIVLTIALGTNTVGDEIVRHRADERVYIPQALRDLTNSPPAPPKAVPPPSREVVSSQSWEPPFKFSSLSNFESGPRFAAPQRKDFAADVSEPRPGPVESNLASKLRAFLLTNTCGDWSSNEVRTLNEMLATYQTVGVSYVILRPTAGLETWANPDLVSVFSGPGPIVGPAFAVSYTIRNTSTGSDASASPRMAPARRGGFFRSWLNED